MKIFVSSGFPHISPSLNSIIGVGGDVERIPENISQFPFQLLPCGGTPGNGISRGLTPGRSHPLVGHSAPAASGVARRIRISFVPA